ncbi:MAG: NADH:ubiquinone oxidoreductase subunit NDUFA12 [Hyphomicrobiales bacterium]|jgi:NADH:ubiquinone oxidoreductase subunit
MKQFFLRFFTWWQDQTFGTMLFTARKGQRVGEDELGNVYYRADVPPLGERRWVIYNGEADASAIAPGWHGWIHKKTDVPPTEDGYVAKAWELPHKPNRTGMPGAYRPDGSILTPTKRPAATGDYEAWSPSD